MEHPTYQIIRFVYLVFLKPINDAQLQIKEELLIITSYERYQSIDSSHNRTGRAITLEDHSKHSMAWFIFLCERNKQLTTTKMFR